MDHHCTPQSACASCLLRDYWARCRRSGNPRTLNPAESGQTIIAKGGVLFLIGMFAFSVKAGFDEWSTKSADTSANALLKRGVFPADRKAYQSVGSSPSEVTYGSLMRLADLTLGPLIGLIVTFFCGAFSMA